QGGQHLDVARRQLARDLQLRDRLGMPSGSQGLLSLLEQTADTGLALRLLLALGPLGDQASLLLIAGLLGLAEARQHGIGAEDRRRLPITDDGHLETLLCHLGLGGLEQLLETLAVPFGLGLGPLAPLAFLIKASLQLAPFAFALAGRRRLGLGDLHL